MNAVLKKTEFQSHIRRMLSNAVVLQPWKHGFRWQEGSLPAVMFTDFWLDQAATVIRSRRAKMAQWGRKEVICGSCSKRYINHGHARSNSRCLRCHIMIEQIKMVASNAVNHAVSQGRIPHADTLPCVDCKGRAECYDHRDYRFPLKVDPVCRGCNVRRGPAAPFNGEGRL